MAEDWRLAGAFADLRTVAARLETHFNDAQDLELTVEQGRLWMLQTRAAKRTGIAAVRFAVVMVEEGRIDPATAVRRVQPDQLSQLLHPTIEPAAEPMVLTVSLPASPGAASGQAVFDPMRRNNCTRAAAQSSSSAVRPLQRIFTASWPPRGNVTARRHHIARRGRGAWDG